MRDQASKLRDMHKLKRLTQEHLHPVRRMAVTSGKGGVGKSNISLSLSLCFQKLGKRTLLVDADTNLANIDILLGINPPFTLADAILGDQFIMDVLVQGPEGLRILPAGSGVVELVGLDDMVADRLEQCLSELERSQDMIILDTGAGISEGVVEFASGSDEVIIITTPEPTAITDAYAAIKVISSRNAAAKLYLLVNQARQLDEANEVARKISLVVENYLAISIETLGWLPADPHVPQAVSRQTPFILAYPRCPAAVNLMMMARRLLKLPGPNTGRSFFQSAFGGVIRNRKSQKEFA
jgi:flagellar biosynthesis protein FlhG